LFGKFIAQKNLEKIPAKKISAKKFPAQKIYFLKKLFDRKFCCKIARFLNFLERRF